MIDTRAVKSGARFARCWAVCLVAMCVCGGCTMPVRHPSNTESATSVTGAIFDGKTLDGWERRGGKAEYRVEDGCIVGETRPNQPNTFLCTKRVYRDFTLELEFKVDDALNSGVQIRSQARNENGAERVYGYQVEIDPSDRKWTGGIYDEARRGWIAPVVGRSEAQAAFKHNEWNTLRVVCRGESIRTWLNGVAAAELSDSMTPEGFIGLQVHGVGARAEPLRIAWRNIRLSEP